MNSVAKWKDRDILDPADKDDLETRAAIHQFHDALPSHEAEEKAHEGYKRDKLIEAAAHHLKGLTSSHAVGDMETAKKHGLLYKLALKELKHDDHLNPPEEVMDKVKNSKEELHKFKAHIGDYFS